MKKTFVTFLILIAVVAMSGVGAMNGPGPAPNSGDGIPDGPGW